MKESEQEMKKITKILKGTTAILMAGVLCACSVKTGTDSSTSNTSTADAPLSNIEEPSLDTVIARATKGDNFEDMVLLYETFRKEYMFYLINKHITDDTEESVAASCKYLRSTIFNNLLQELVSVQKAKEYGVDELTEEDNESIEKQFNETLEYYVGYIVSEMSQTSDTSGEESLSDEEKRERATQTFDEYLEKSGLTREDFRWWAQSGVIAQKLQAKLAEEVDYSEAETKLQEEIEKAENLYKNDLTTYVQGGYFQAWLPEGSRFIKHVLLGFDSDKQTEIRQLRTDGKDDEADKARAEAAEALKSQQDEIKKKLDEGANIDELIEQFSADKAGSESSPNGYTVIPGVEGMWMAEFQETAFVPEKIGDTAVCVTDYGVHIMQYAGVAEVDQSVLEKFKDAYFEQLKQTRCNEAMAKWIEEYAFEIDYAALRLDDPAAEESSSVSQ